MTPTMPTPTSESEKEHTALIAAACCRLTQGLDIDEDNDLREWIAKGDDEWPSIDTADLCEPALSAPTLDRINGQGGSRYSHLAPAEQGEARALDILERHDEPVAMVARSVSKAELKREPAAEQSVLNEWKKLRLRECWEERSPKE